MAETAATENIPLRVQCAVYASGYLSTSMQNMAGLLIPLWVVMTLDPSPFMVGILLGARHFLPTLLAIHGGAMMDHLGAKRVMIASAILAFVVHLVYPVTSWVWLVIILQMLGGLAVTTSWMGTQTLIGQVMKGDTTHSGRLSAAALMGNLTVPPIIGAAWDYLGAWGGFLTMSLWAAGLFVAALVLPAPSAELSRGQDRMRASDFIPRPKSYLEAFALLAVPAIAMVVTLSILRNSTYAIRGSFFVVYLDSINLSGTEIGLLMAASGLLGAGAALMTGRLTKVFNPVILLLLTVAGAIVFMCIPPVTEAFWLLMLFAVVWGASAAMSMSLMFSILSRAADARSQGKSVGLRLTANRMAATVLPIVMGAVADIWGVSASFFIIGAALLSAVGIVALFARRVIAAGG